MGKSLAEVAALTLQRSARKWVTNLYKQRHANQMADQAVLDAM